MRAFVTGGTGMLGNNLVRTLVEHGWEVRALCRQRAKAERVLGGLAVEWVEGDLEGLAGWEGALAGCEVVFHTAAMFREYDGTDPDAWSSLLRVNVDGTLALAEAAARRGVRRFVDTSTGGIIGPAADGGAGHEDSPPGPIAYENLYFRSKLETLKRLDEVGAQRGLEIIHIHPGWMFGPYDAAPTAAGRLVQDFLAGRLPAVPAGGSTIADARDVAFGMMRAAEKAPPGSRWVLGGHHATLGEVVALLAEISGRPAPRLHLPGWLALAFAWVSERVDRLLSRPSLITVMAMKTVQSGLRLDSTRAERDLGVRFRPLRETMTDVVGWVGQGR